MYPKGEESIYKLYGIFFYTYFGKTLKIEKGLNI